jgi:hypothetical protein
MWFICLFLTAQKGIFSFYTGHTHDMLHEIWQFICVEEKTPYLE